MGTCVCVGGVLMCVIFVLTVSGDDLQISTTIKYSCTLNFTLTHTHTEFNTQSTQTTWFRWTLLVMWDSAYLQVPVCAATHLYIWGDCKQYRCSTGECSLPDHFIHLWFQVWLWNVSYAEVLRWLWGVLWKVNEEDYRGMINSFAVWCQSNHLQLNTSKML